MIWVGSSDLGPFNQTWFNEWVGSWVVGWFLPEASFGLRVLSSPVSVCVCINHLLVHTITRHLFKLRSPNLVQRSKAPWLRYLLFWGLIDIDLQGQIELQTQNWPHFELVQTITHHLFKLGFPNLDHKCILALLRSLLIWGLIDLELHFHFLIPKLICLHCGGKSKSKKTLFNVGQCKQTTLALTWSEC